MEIFVSEQWNDTVRGYTCGGLAELKPPRSTKNALQWGLRCRARAYWHGKKHVDLSVEKYYYLKINKKKTFLSWESVFLTYPDGGWQVRMNSSESFRCNSCLFGYFFFMSI